MYRRQPMLGWSGFSWVGNRRAKCLVFALTALSIGFLVSSALGRGMLILRLDARKPSFGRYEAFSGPAPLFTRDTEIVTGNSASDASLDAIDHDLQELAWLSSVVKLSRNRTGAEVVLPPVVLTEQHNQAPVGGLSCSSAVRFAAIANGYRCEEHSGPGGQALCCCVDEDRDKRVPFGPRFTCLPTLIIVGAQKSGTTALVGYLLRHPFIAIGPRKELHVFDKEKFFDGPDKDYAVRPSGLMALLKVLPELNAPLLVDGALPRVNRITIDATPSYMLGVETPHRIVSALPSAVAIALLRDPVSRAHSEWNMKARRVQIQTRLDDRRSMQATIEELRLCVASSLFPLLKNVQQLELNADAASILGEQMGFNNADTSGQSTPESVVARWWITSSALTAESPRDEARACLGRVLSMPNLKPLQRLGEGVLATTSSCVMEAIAPRGDASWGEKVSRIAKTMLRGKQDNVASQLSGAFGCDEDNVCLGMLLLYGFPESTRRLMSIYGGSTTQHAVHIGPRLAEVDEVIGSCLTIHGRRIGTSKPDISTPSGNVELRYETLVPWPDVLTKELRQITKCSALAQDRDTTVRLIAEVIRSPAVHVSVGVEESEGERAVLLDGGEYSGRSASLPPYSCWPSGSSSNIARDFLYRGVYVSQVARLSSVLAPRRLLLVADSQLRESPQSILNALTKLLFLPSISVSGVTSSALDALLDKAFPTFESNGWRLNSTGISSELSNLDASLLRTFFRPYNAALLDWLGTLDIGNTEVGRGLTNAVRSWMTA